MHCKEAPEAQGRSGKLLPFLYRDSKRVSRPSQHDPARICFSGRHIAEVVAMAKGPLCPVPVFLHCRFRLMLEKNSESESVRDQQQRHYQSRKEECGSQLSRQ
jgi:hypothetical protein